MPIDFTIDSTHKVIICTHRGIVSDEEFLLSYQKHIADPAVDLSFSRLVDLRRADSSPRSPDALKKLAQAFLANLPESRPIPKIAVIAPDSLSFGLGRMYEAFSATAPAEFVVFRDIDAALAWLRLPEDYDRIHDAPPA